MWRKGNLLVLLVGMQTAAATLENSMEVPQKVKNGTTLKCRNCTISYSEKEYKILIQRDTCTLMFIAAISTIAKVWKQPKSTLTDKWIKKKWCIYQWNITQPSKG